MPQHGNTCQHSSAAIATRYGARRSGDRTPVGVRFSALVQTDPVTHPASYTMRTVSFPEVKRPGRSADHTPPSSAEVKERVQLYLYSPLWTFMACSRVNCTFYCAYTSSSVTMWSLNIEANHKKYQPFYK